MVDFEKDRAPDPQPGFAPQGAPPTGYPPPGYPAYGPPPGYPPAFGPPPGLGQPVPSNNIGWAIAALFTFWPLAIPAFIFSSRVEPYWFQGNWFAAQKASHDARLYGLIAVIVGAVFAVIGVLIFIFVFVVFADTVHEINRHIPTFTPQPYPS